MGTNRAQVRELLMVKRGSYSLPFGAKYGQLGYGLITTKLQTLHRSSRYRRSLFQRQYL